MSETQIKPGAIQSVDDLLAHRGRIVDLLPAGMAEDTRRDAEYHGRSAAEWIEKNQITAIRNLRFHNQSIDFVRRGLSERSAILEIAGGVGCDAAIFCRSDTPFHCYVLSEVSPELLEHARASNPEFAEKPVVFCCMDACRLMLTDAQFDAVFMIAALHHFPDLSAAIRDIDRVARDGATIVFGIEPNSLWLGGLGFLRPLYRKLLPRKDHSQADEKARGFRRQDFARIAAQTGWRLEKLVPVWFFAGFLHYGLEFCFRILRLSKRIRLPRLVEKCVLLLDDLFFCLPYADEIAWHYTAVFRKK